MAVLAVDVIGFLEIHHLLHVFRRHVALTALFRFLPRGPQVFSVVIFMVAVPARHLVVQGVLAMGKCDRTLAVRIVALILDDNHIQI